MRKDFKQLINYRWQTSHYRSVNSKRPSGRDPFGSPYVVPPSKREKLPIATVYYWWSVKQHKEEPKWPHRRGHFEIRDIKQCIRAIFIIAILHGTYAFGWSWLSPLDLTMHCNDKSVAQYANRFYYWGRH